MALFHPSDPSPGSHEETPTRHPMVCVLSGFGFIIGAALLVHLVFNVLL